jgi:hypothetical protein
VSLNISRKILTKIAVPGIAENQIVLVEYVTAGLTGTSLRSVKAPFRGRQNHPLFFVARCPLWPKADMGFALHIPLNRTTVARGIIRKNNEAEVVF